MKKQLIFNQEEITVFQVTYPDARGIEFEVSNAETTFSTSEKPWLSYKSLKNKLRDYKAEKEAAYAADTREDDFESNFWANFDKDSEGF